MGVTLADVFRRFGQDYRREHPQGILPSHDRVLRDVVACHTPALGGHLWHCPQCQQDIYLYHGCRNRSCPACHADQTHAWLQERQGELLPCEYFHLTATVPEGLRSVFYGHQKLLYGLLMRLTGQCLLELMANPKHLGATPAILQVLHTWTAKLAYHPHVHCLVSGGGLSPDGRQWVSCRPGFLLSVRVVSRHLRSLFERELRQKHPQLYQQVPPDVWKQQWVVHCVPWGNGQQGVLQYLARYVYRIAISNSRILGIDQRTVKFRYKDRKGNRLRTCDMEATQFIGLFLQHVLPRGFHKVRYLGLWHPKRREQAQRVRQMLSLKTPAMATEPLPEPTAQDPRPALSCPHCGCGNLRHVRELPRPPIRGP